LRYIEFQKQKGGSIGEKYDQIKTSSWARIITAPWQVSILLRIKSSFFGMLQWNRNHQFQLPLTKRCLYELLFAISLTVRAGLLVHWQHFWV
jgi:hypothetical protein